MQCWWAPGAGLLAALLLLAACAPLAPPDPTADPIVGPALLARPNPTPTVGRSFNLGLALPDPRQEPWRSLVYGAREEATRRGVELALPAARGASPAERQASQLRELVQRRVDLALVVGGDGPLLAAAVDEASAHGLPLAGLSSSVSVERLVFRVGTDWYAMGRLQAECLGAVIGGRGQVARLTGPSTSLTASIQAEGFREALHQRFPRIELVAEQSALLDRPGAAEVVGGWLTRWPELAGVAADAEAPAIGALDALYAANRLGLTRVAAAQLSPFGKRSLQDGGIRCSTAQQAVAEGQAAVRNALAYLAGEPFERNIKSPPLLATTDRFAQIDWAPIRAPGKTDRAAARLAPT